MSLLEIEPDNVKTIKWSVSLPKPTGSLFSVLAQMFRALRVNLRRKV
jgi:hypothetical protein